MIKNRFYIQSREWVCMEYKIRNIGSDHVIYQEPIDKPYHTQWKHVNDYSSKKVANLMLKFYRFFNNRLEFRVVEH